MATGNWVGLTRYLTADRSMAAIRSRYASAPVTCSAAP